MDVFQSSDPNMALSRSEDSLNAYQAELDDVSIEMRNNFALDDSVCEHCDEDFPQGLEVVQCNGKKWHKECFVCAQCFNPFPDGVYYDFGGRKYCEHDFHVLFAPCCGSCGEFVIGRVIKAMSKSWHPQCFRCADCEKVLVDEGFVKNARRALCHSCNARQKADQSGRYVCQRCHGYVAEEDVLKFRGENYHPYHFTCQSCDDELTNQAREVSGELYCLRCHDKMSIAICGACRRPIEERIVYAMGKAWHVEHFVCAQCEKPFLGSKHYERRGLAYCELHFQQLFGELCQRCHQITGEQRVSSMNKIWCVEHFCCSTCDRQLMPEDKFYEFDLKPVCKKCYERFPKELRKRLAKIHKTDHQKVNRI